MAFASTGMVLFPGARGESRGYVDLGFVVVAFTLCLPFLTPPTFAFVAPFPVAAATAVDFLLFAVLTWGIAPALLLALLVFAAALLVLAGLETTTATEFTLFLFAMTEMRMDCW